jgi:hypothetical protein
MGGVFGASLAKAGDDIVLVDTINGMNAPGEVSAVEDFSIDVGLGVNRRGSTQIQG